MSRRPRPALKRAVTAAKLAVVVAVSSLALAGLLDGPPPAPEHDVAEADAARADAEHTRLDRMMARHGCSHTGLGPGVEPGSALVRRGDRVRHVSFDRGWAVFTGEAPGELVAVCRDGVSRRF